MEVLIQSKKAQEIIKEIAKGFGEHATLDCMEMSFSTGKRNNQLFFSGMDFKEGLSLLLLKGNVDKEFTLYFDEKHTGRMFFNFCKEGALTHILDGTNIQYNLSTLQSSLTLNPVGKNQSFILPDGQNILFSILIVDLEKFNQKLGCEVDKLPENLQKVFELKTGTEPFIHQSNYSVSIAECLNDMLENEYKDLVRATFLESQAVRLLSLQLKQYFDDMENPSEQKVLREYDIEKLVEAKKILLSNLKNPPTIPELAKMVGINQQKLKSGFKSIFAMTIGSFVRSERLKLGKMLLLQNHQSVRDVAIEVGYSNPSNFTKWFKKSYGVYPKNFKKSFMENNQPGLEIGE
ncbi:MAG: AraC family transcriptional regulator [Saprospiraceae bacterium]